MPGPLDLSGHVVLVTGGARGVGRGIATSFLEAGASVVICGRHEPETSPTGGGRWATFTPCDVRDAEQVSTLIDSIVERFGRLDVAVRPPPLGGESGSWRPQMTTDAPASRKLVAMPRPTPRAPPVTSTTCPDRSSVAAITTFR